MARADRRDGAGCVIALLGVPRPLYVLITDGPGRADADLAARRWRCSASGSSARCGAVPRRALMPYTLFQGGRGGAGGAGRPCWRCCWCSRASRRARRSARARAGARRAHRAPTRRCDAGRRRWPAAARRRRRWRCGSRTRGDPVARALHASRRAAGLLFDLDTGRVLWRHEPTARAADRLADEDDDRARGRPTASRAGAKVRDHASEALRLPGARASGCSRAASGSGSRRCSTGCCCRRATTRRSRSPSARRATVPRLRAR